MSTPTWKPSGRTDPHNTRVMIILGIDPGLAKLGYGVITYAGGDLRYLDAGVLTTPPSLPTPQRLAMLMDRLEEHCNHRKPARIVLERLFPGPHRNLGKVAEVRGIALLLAGRRGIPVLETSPKAIKTLLTRYGSAEKMQMRRTVQRILGMPELPPADAADALALAISGAGRLP